jgi:hypothetical protein
MSEKEVPEGLGKELTYYRNGYKNGYDKGLKNCKEYTEGSLKELRGVWDKGKNDNGLLEILRCTHIGLWQTIDNVAKKMGWDKK